ncbi:4Fe-4S cluster-binding domain-containing protein [Campylobacter novaezeelandiae]|uniref:4Fe-4S cluster-binding domain-containing protein n=1 Tax=Campylobacter novaezeelandiae TaxID=2267891 RepID=A0A4Q9JUH0_9BACT|nr:radical SAM protein [Campylobacter novaezeelandiae]TBR81304.1 4Fe-4S cluster-binding domain-containing protein [Campylobacter novaezeelandiae]
MQRFKQWFLSIIKNYKRQEIIRERANQLETRANQLETRANQLETRANQLETRANQLETRANQLETRANQVLDFHLRKITPQAFLEVVEIHLAEHCNLNCFGCNHFSQLANEEFPDILKFEEDMKTLARISEGFIKTFRLMGGEPLLNPQCKEFIEITRKYFPKSAIWLVTNGILLNKQKEDFWLSCQKNNVEIRPTKYPLNIKWEEIKNLCQKYQVSLVFFNDEKTIKTSWKFSLDSLGKCDNYNSFINCSMANHCIQFKDGKLFTCPISAHIEHFNKKFVGKDEVKTMFKISKFDYIDIYGAKNYQEILTFLAKPIPFCRYCKVLEWKEVGIWRKSSKNINEYLMDR